MAITAGMLEVQINDENGTPAPARVYLLDSAGRPYYPDRVIRYDKSRPDGVSEQHFVPPRGEFAIELPAGTYRLTVERGKEYVPFNEQITIRATDRVTAV